MYKIHMKFVLFGASGSGKSTILRMVSRLLENTSIHKKDSDRDPRKTEDPNGELEMNFVKKVIKEDCDIVYHLYGHEYGVKKDQIIRAFENKEIHFIIINEVSAIKQFKYMYPDAKAIYIHVDPKSLPENLKEREGIEVEERRNRVIRQYQEYLDNNTLFDHVILNFWELGNTSAQFRNIFHYYMRISTINI